MDLSRREALGLAAGMVGSAGVAKSATGPAGEAKPGRTPNTRFAVNVEMWWRGTPFADRIRKAAEFGFPGIEFWDYRLKRIPEIAKLSKELGLEVAQFTAWGFWPGLNNPKNHTKFVEQIREALDVADELDCKLMTVVGGDNQRGMTQAEMHQAIIEGFKLAAPLCEKRGVTMILEPMNVRVDHKKHCLYGSEPTIEICKAVDSPAVRINWDLYHMQITEGDLIRRLEAGFEYVGYLQLADNPGRHEPGTGEIYYPKVLEAAHRLGYRGLVGLECSPKEGEETAAARVAAADFAWG